MNVYHPIRSLMYSIPLVSCLAISSAESADVCISTYFAYADGRLERTTQCPTTTRPAPSVTVPNQRTGIKHILNEQTLQSLRNQNTITTLPKP